MVLLSYPYVLKLLNTFKTYGFILTLVVHISNMWGEVTTYYVSTVMETVVIIECHFEDSTNYVTEGMKREERGEGGLFTKKCHSCNG